MDLRDYLFVLRRRWRAGAAACLLVLFAAGAGIAYLPVQYRAKGKIFCADPLSGGYEALRSQGLLDGSTLGSLTQLLTTPELWQRVAERVDSLGLNEEGPIRDPPARRGPVEAGRSLAASLDLKRVDGTSYFLVGVLESSAVRAVRALHAFVSEASTLWRERLRAEAASGQDILAKRAVEVDRALHDYQASLDDLRLAAGLTGPTLTFDEELRLARDALQERLRRMQELEESRRRVEQELTDQRQAGTLDITAENVDLHLAGLPAMGWFNDLNERLLKNEIKLLAELSTKTERHPDVARLRGEIDQDRNLMAAVFEQGHLLNQYLERSKRLVRTAEERKALGKRIELKSLEAVLESNRTAQRARQSALDDLMGIRDRYLELSRKLEATRRSRAQIDQASAELRILAAGPDVPLVVPVDLAQDAERQGRRPGQLWLLAVVLALTVGAAAAGLREHVDSVLHGPQDLRRWLGFTALASIPRRRLAARDQVEAFSSLARVILSHDHIRTVLVASVEKQIGRTLVTAELARAAARLGRRVAAVDADARQPALHCHFERPNTHGLTDLLSGELRARRRIQSLAGRRLRGEAVAGQVLQRQRGRDDDVLLLPSGPLRPHFARLLESPAAAALLQSLADDNDLVLIDSAPLSICGDALSLARHVDGVILVAYAGVTRAGTVSWAKKAIGEVGGVFLGVVLNGVRPLSPPFTPVRSAGSRQAVVRES